MFNCIWCQPFFVPACSNPTDVRLKMRSNLLACSLGQRDVGFWTFKQNFYLAVEVLPTATGRRLICLKAFLLQAIGGPDGSRKLRLLDFFTMAQYGGRLSALRTDRLYPQGYSWYSFSNLLRDSLKLCCCRSNFALLYLTVLAFG